MRNDAGKQPGHERRHHAVDVGRAGADGDQREHVQPAACTIDRQPRTKNGQPPHSTTGVASSSSIQCQRPAQPEGHRGCPGSICDHRQQQQRNGERQAHDQNRRVMSTSSGLAASATTVRAPAPCRTSGTRRARLLNLRVHRAGVLDVSSGPSAASCSRAMPHDGHGPGCDCRTSGHIGQKYARSPPEVATSAEAATLTVRALPKKAPGLMRNLSRQCAQQNKYVVPWNSARWGLEGSTSIPHTGSRWASAGFTSNGIEIPP